MRFLVPRKSLRNGPMTTGMLRHLTESTGPSGEQLMQTWGQNSQSEPIAPHSYSKGPQQGLLTAWAQQTGNAEWKIPCGYAIAIQLHQIHQLAVKMNIKKMFKTLKTLGRKQIRNEYKSTRSFYFVRRGKVSKHLQKHPGLLINSELQIKYNLNSKTKRRAALVGLRKRSLCCCRHWDTLMELIQLASPTRKRPECSNNITRQSTLLAWQMGELSQESKRTCLGFHKRKQQARWHMRTPQRLESRVGPNRGLGGGQGRSFNFLLGLWV